MLGCVSVGALVLNHAWGANVPLHVLDGHVRRECRGEWIARAALRWKLGAFLLMVLFVLLPLQRVVCRRRFDRCGWIYHVCAQRIHEVCLLLGLQWTQAWAGGRRK